MKISKAIYHDDGSIHLDWYLLSTLLNCESMFGHLASELRDVNDTSDAALWGIAWHKAMEWTYKGIQAKVIDINTPITWAKMAETDVPGMGIRPELSELILMPLKGTQYSLDRIVPRYNKYWATLQASGWLNDIDILGVEQDISHLYRVLLKANATDIVYHAKVDLQVHERSTDLVYIIDHKTQKNALSDLTLDLWLDLAQQVTGWLMLGADAQLDGVYNFGGAMIHHLAISNQQCTVIPIPCNQRRVDAFRAMMIQAALSILERIKRGENYIVGMNSNECTRWYRKCPYWELCVRGNNEGLTHDCWVPGVGWQSELITNTR